MHALYRENTIGRCNVDAVIKVLKDYDIPIQKKKVGEKFRIAEY